MTAQQKSFVTIYLIFTLGDIFLLFSQLDLASDIRLFILLIVWIVMIFVLKSKSTVTYSLILGYICLLLFTLLFFQTKPFSERLVSLIFFFLWIGIIQKYFELKNESKT